MFENISDISIATEQDGQVMIKQLEKNIIETGAFPVLLFRYQTWSEKENRFDEEEYLLMRYQRKHEQYVPIAKFRISSREQAEKIAEALKK